MWIATARTAHHDGIARAFSTRAGPTPLSVPFMTTFAPAPAAFDEDRIDRFGFGQNWLDYQTSINQARLITAREDIELWLGQKSLSDCRVLDIGSGSGIHSYCMHAMGARELVSFDYDANSVAATREFHEKAGKPSSWKVIRGSVLDSEFMASLGTFDLVYSWGVLHHTGQMWQAIANAAARVERGGRFFISIYAKGPQFAADLRLKQRYHNASLSGKRRIEFEWIVQQYEHRVRNGLPPEGWWTESCERGMDPYYDLVDWLGGLPYEVATMPELTQALRGMGLETRRTRECPADGGCHILVAERTSMQAIATSPSANPAAAIVRNSWPQVAPVIWIGAFDSADGPERIVPIARSLPQIAFVMVAKGFSELDAATRNSLERVAPNLRIVDHPGAASDIDVLARHAGVLLHTGDAGPSPEWLAMAGVAGVPVVSLHADRHGTINEAGLGMVGAGDLQAVANALASLQRDSTAYSRVSLALVSWSANRCATT